MAMGYIIDGTGDCFSGEGRWNREARRVSQLATELGVALDEEALLLYDIGELLSLRFRLEATRRRDRQPVSLVERLRAVLALPRRFARLRRRQSTA